MQQNSQGNYLVDTQGRTAKALSGGAVPRSLSDREGLTRGRGLAAAPQAEVRGHRAGRRHHGGQQRRGEGVRLLLREWFEMGTWSHFDLGRRERKWNPNGPHSTPQYPPHTLPPPPTQEMFWRRFLSYSAFGLIVILWSYSAHRLIRGVAPSDQNQNNHPVGPKSYKRNLQKVKKQARL